MLSEVDARVVVKNAFPTASISNPIDYQGVYVFKVITPDPLEGDQDPFYSVNKTTGELRDYSVITDGDINEITDLFLKANH